MDSALSTEAYLSWPLNGTSPRPNISKAGRGGVDVWSGVSVLLEALICLTGLVGNALVIVVVARYSRMKTVTNTYLLNLAVADLCFLVGLPALITTQLLRHWVFGAWGCKLFLVSTSINWYTSVFTLTAMSADRYLAVCHAVSSLRYRTPRMALGVCAGVWALSLLTMLPTMLYSRETRDPDSGHCTCEIVWPDGPIPGQKAFIWYAFLLGFAVPTVLISVFYCLVVAKLYTLGPAKKSRERLKSNRKVTVMVLSVITVYVVCWLPYWLFQIVLNHHEARPPIWAVSLFQAITVLSYANSSINPLLYAFLSENFRLSFVKAFHCARASEANSTLQPDPSTAGAGRGNRRNLTTLTAPHTMALIGRGEAEGTEEETAEEKRQELKERKGDEIQEMTEAGECQNDSQGQEPGEG